MKRLIAWRLAAALLGGYFLVLGVVAYAGLRYMQGAVKPAVRQTLEAALVDQVGLLAVQLSNANDDDLVPEAQRLAIAEWLRAPRQAKVYNVLLGAPSERVYVTDAQGVVVYDSQGRDMGADYTKWRDVARTLRGNYGARSTHEQGVDAPAVLYVAAPIVRRGRLAGVVSLGKPAQDLEPFVALERRRIARIGAFALLLCGATALAISAYFGRAIGRLTQFSERVADGLAAEAPKLRGELGVLARALDTMRHKLEGKHYVEETVQTLTHEMRSPLTAITASSEVVAEGMRQGPERALVQSMGAEAVRLSALVDRMLALAVVDQMRGLERSARVDFAILARTLVERETPRAALREVTLLVEGQAALWGDAFLLEHALANLLSNAVDFAQAGSTVRVSLSAKDARVTLRVSNVGPPIPDYAFSRIFERFFSTERPDTGRKSTGLGLAFVKRVTELHGGDIALVNVDAGVEACWSLPVSSGANSSNLHRA